jgi:O-antigen/teichoic acid export membrane protein
LIYIGFSVFGALVGFILANIIGWVLTAYFIGSYDFSQNFKYIKGFLIYSIPVIIQSFAITSLYSVDLILVKHFFTSYEAGLYASLSTLGRIIFFGAGPIAAVMFPMVAKRFSEGQGYRNIMVYSVILTLGLCGGVLFVYWLFPEFAISILYGQSYIGASNLLIYMGIFMTLFTLSSLLISYYLSVGKTKVVILPLLASIAQFVGIWIYHQTLFNVIMISNIVSSLLLLSLLIYFAYERSKINISHSPSL